MADWLIDDAEEQLLGETLSLLASWEERDSVSGASAARKNATQPAMTERRGRSEGEEKNEPASLSDDARTVAATTARRPGRVNATRERRRQEIIVLRNETEQLQAQLDALQQRRASILKPHYRNGAIQSTFPVWESMARRHFQSRRRTEEYNARLRQELHVQTQVAQELMNAIQLAMQRQTLRTSSPRVRRPVDVGQRLSEDEQLQRLEYNLLRWQWALSLSRKFARGELDFTDLVVTTTDASSVTIELCHSHVQPFSVDVVGDLLHSFFQAVSSDREGDDEDVEKSVHKLDGGKELVVAAFNVDSRMGPGTISGKWMGNHSSTASGDQRLICDQWQYEMSGFDDALDGVSVVEDVWQRLVDAKQIGHTQFSEPVTVMQLVRRLHVNFNRSERVDPSYTKTVVKFFEESVKGKIRQAQQNVGDMLMDQAIRSTKSSG